jgi:hypothetical protein
MSVPSDDKELLSQLKEKTKENLKTLAEQGTIFKDEQLQKNYTVNNSVEYLNKKAIPINIIYHSLYDQETKCQLSNNTLSFNRHIFESQKDYDIKFDKQTLDNSSAPKFFKMEISEAVKNYIESSNSIKDNLDDLNNYPIIFEFNYNYQHPVPKPVFMGPKLLENTDHHKIIFISPICLYIESKGESKGFTGMDSFYTAIRHKFEMELNDDLTIKKTIYNNYFGVNFIKSNWLEGKIKSTAFEQAEEGFNGSYLPLITKELNLTVKKYFNAPNVKKILLNNKMINSRDISMTQDDLIINDSFISDIDEDNDKYKINNKNKIIKQNDEIKDMLFNNIYLIIFIFIIFFLCIFLGKEYIIILLLILILYLLFSINQKLDKLYLTKHA